MYNYVGHISRNIEFIYYTPGEALFFFQVCPKHVQMINLSNVDFGLIA